MPADTKFLGTDFNLVESTEPTNIIWENRHWTPKDYLKRGLIVFTIIGFLILASFSLIFYCKSFSIQIFSKYPTVECPVLEKAYLSPSGVNLLPDYAQREFDAFYKPGEGKEPTPFSGALQCYCDQLSKSSVSLLNF